MMARLANDFFPSTFFLLTVLLGPVHRIVPHACLVFVLVLPR